MNKELQDLAWRSLPKEFKEEVKFEYLRVATKVIKSNYDLGFMNAHEGMYGIHNLTSDAEGEDEMLYVSRKKVQRRHRMAYESDLEPYAEAEETKAEEIADKSIKPVAEHFDNIQQNSIAKERRLAIAAQMMQGLICAPLVPGVDPNPPAEYLAQTPFRLADALIAEWRKD